ncbi:threonine synthase [Cohnella zeiphila]|uniref:Threonine synthase n=1 Tax=Cohnella zeiphila TaxID=2761120 RepID=A0A7X0SGE2_9BACL|nr:threonine synthase [Cohnella zeiphila]MBB6729452.1 threonine synthase [Cohnella zeiphila]
MNKCWLRCTRCSRKTDFRLIGKCPECRGTLLVEYDMDQARPTFTKKNLSRRSEASLWRYHELLPIHSPKSAVSLGEGWTPLVRLPSLEARLGLKRALVKREEQNPTGSFKARGFAVAVSLLSERGIAKAAVPSNGNAASAFAAYAARAGIEAHVFLPRDCPPLIVEECRLYGAHTTLVDGMIHDAGQRIDALQAEQGWFNAGTLREPGRVEGKKTMGFEIAEQFGWKLPDVIVYPTGGGSGIIGLWKAFNELQALGLVDGCLPRLISVQEEGCRPIVDAMASAPSPADSGAERTASPTGMRVPLPPDLDLLVSILGKTGGTAVAVGQDEIRSAQRTWGTCGISASPEGAATLAGLLKLREAQGIDPDETVVLFNTSHALKYLTPLSTGTHE